MKKGRKLKEDLMSLYTCFIKKNNHLRLLQNKIIMISFVIKLLY